MEESVAAGGAAGGGLVFIIQIAITVIMVVALWKIFTKAGKPGWASIIPIYNAYVMLQIAGKPGWWLLLMFIPIVNIVIAIMMIAGISSNFGKSIGFTVGLILLPIIFYPMLAFGNAGYQQIETAVPV